MDAISLNFSSSSIPLDSATPSGDLGPLGTALGEVKQQLQQFFSEPDVLTKLDYVFDITDYQQARTLISNGSAGALVLPTIEVVSAGAMEGAFGAYAKDTQTIYLSDALLGVDTPVGTAARSLLEEYGHHLDTLLNPGGDTAGDEGELFSAQVLAQTLSPAELSRILGEDDRGTLTVAGRELEVEFDNTPATAINVGQLKGSRSFTDVLSSSDIDDYYRFQLQYASNFSLTLNGYVPSDLSYATEVRLLKDDGTEIAGTYLGIGAQPINQQLAKGTYLVHIFQEEYTYNSVYTLNLISDIAGNTQDAALNVGQLKGNKVYQDFVSSSDTNDYYRFQLQHASNFSLTLNGLSADADVELLNNSGTVIGSSSAGGSTAESINQALSAGTYFVRIYQYSGDTNYTLNLTSDIAGNTPGTAFNVGSLNGTKTYNDFVNSSDTNDYYRFTLSEASSFTATLNGLQANADLQLLYENGNVIQSSTASGKTADSINTFLNAGNYLIRIYSYSSASTNYKLTLNAVPDIPGNASTPISVPIGGSRSSNIDFNGDSDWFRVAIEAGRTYNFSLNGGTLSDPFLNLYNNSSTVIASDDNSGEGLNSLISNFTPTTPTSSGNYFLGAKAFGSGTGSYTVAASIVDGAGNSTGAARDLGIVNNTTKFFRDTVGTSDTNDYYRFQLSSGRNVSLLLNELTADADLELLTFNNAGALISVLSSSFGGTTADSINTFLNAGNYFVRVFPYSSVASINYALTLAA